MFFIWLAIATIQICLFSIFLFGQKVENKQEETIDTFPIYVYNGMAYWYEEGFLYRTKYKARGMSLDSKSKVDHLNSEDLSPSDLIHIINELEEAEK